MACRNCKWLDVSPDRDGVIRVRKTHAYRCTVPEPPRPKLPVCITLDYHFRWPPSRRYVCGDETRECPFFEGRQ